MRIETLQDMLDYLKTLSKEELSQPAQIVPHHVDGDIPLELHSIIDVDTIKTYFGDEEDDQKTRSTKDNKHHPESIVFLTDLNPFGEDGHIAINLLTGEKIYPRNKS